MTCRITTPPPNFHVYEKVFTRWLESDAYRLWKLDELKFQLRCYGGPGSGKTTFSSQVVKDLKRSTKATNTAVVSIFLQPLNEAPGKRPPFLNLLLVEIRQQLWSSLNSIPRGQNYDYRRSNAEVEVLPQVDVSIGDLRQTIASQIKSFDQAFLILDDLDLAWIDIEEYKSLEDELDALMTQGLKILTTSRVQFRCDTRSGICDVNPGHKHLDLWWECSECAGKESLYFICDECKLAGHRCLKPEHTKANLIQPRQRVHLDIGNYSLQRFIEYHLEQDHGDLGFGSHGGVSTLPPSSPLGHELINSAHKNAANNLVANLIKQANGNITLALLRLEHVSKAISLEEAISIADRLPRNIVASFDAGMASIGKSPPGLRRDLGLASIKLVGGSEDGLRYSDLKEQIVEDWDGDVSDVEALLDSEYGMEEVLAASRGYLSRTESRVPGVVCFHYNFQFYVADRYSDFIDS
ncbi:uncharacterized protein JN550_000630 [Neoarthrinium moseri]|uniref:uncharacterized protein n=1 Tax=Neoarthrinium moseri TaxID=1658444 RepID=UPI001FDE3118|nr:uncharacterized protein JN550_000630 [Neoarthrinium moseri]KAI1878448.1 hypothetical protein JN550_000630 [Neoarthrinium moseri]